MPLQEGSSATIHVNLNAIRALVTQPAIAVNPLGVIEHPYKYECQCDN